MLRKKAVSMINWKYIRDTLRQPHPGYADLRVYFYTILGIACVIFLILSIFQPFNVAQRNIAGDPYITAVFYAGSALVTMFASTLWIICFPRWFSEKNWTLGKEMLIILYQMSSIAITVWVINGLRDVMLPGVTSYLKTLVMVFSTGILPYILATLIRHVYFLKRNLKKAQEFNEKQQLRMMASQAVSIELSGLKEKIWIDKLYYVEAQGNNLRLTCTKEGVVYTMLCRCTMKEFERVVAQFPQLARCHRSFIINLSKIVKIEGNAGGYFLHLPHDLPIVPVSRVYMDNFKQRLQEL